MNLNNARRMLNELSVRDTEMVSTWSGNPLDNIVKHVIRKGYDVVISGAYAASFYLGDLSARDLILSISPGEILTEKALYEELVKDFPDMFVQHYMDEGKSSAEITFADKDTGKVYIILITRFGAPTAHRAHTVDGTTFKLATLTETLAGVLWSILENRYTQPVTSMKVAYEMLHRFSFDAENVKLCLKVTGIDIMNSYPWPDATYYESVEAKCVALFLDDLILMWDDSFKIPFDDEIPKSAKNLLNFVNNIFKDNVMIYGHLAATLNGYKLSGDPHVICALPCDNPDRSETCTLIVNSDILEDDKTMLSKCKLLPGTHVMLPPIEFVILGELIDGSMSGEQLNELLLEYVKRAYNFDSLLRFADMLYLPRRMVVEFIIRSIWN